MLHLPPLHYFPIATSILFPFTFFLSYGISVGLGHTEFDWPYISDTSTHPPESCIFAQLINLGALLIAITVYIRFRQVDEFYRSREIRLSAVRVNDLALILGWTAAMGISLIANFQETNVFPVHFIGAILAFGVGALYLWTQIHSSLVLLSITHGSKTLWIRILLSVVCSVGFITAIVAESIARSEFHGHDKSKWLPTDGGWTPHVVSTVSEWIVALAFDVFILTFVNEFKQIALSMPNIVVRVNRVDTLFDANRGDVFEEAESLNVSLTT